MHKMYNITGVHLPQKLMIYFSLIQTYVYIFCFAGKSFDITYVRLKFHSSRPESFAIFKRTTEDSPWIPYQFYSASCQDTYRRRNHGIIDRSDETVAICTDEFSDISPLTGGSVAFSTLEGRPGAFNFENSPVLQVNILFSSI